MEHSFAPHSPGFNPLVGTASWSDKTLLDCGKFYPPTAKTPEARLRFYASQFNLVEVDTSYYAIPAVTTAQHWAERPGRSCASFAMRPLRCCIQAPPRHPCLSPSV